MITQTRTYLSTARRSAVEFLRDTGFLAPSIMQVGAICHRTDEDGVKVLLITSLGTKQWIIPKGWPKKNCSSAQTALEESYEEAGIRGTVSEAPIGRYTYQKQSKKGLMLDCVASVYEIAVSETLDKFPEAGRRKQAWLSPEAAADRVTNPDLKKLLADFKPQIPAR
ncbi:MAG: NUDIX hydrolase [Hyphomonadaceae bacterium]